MPSGGLLKCNILWKEESHAFLFLPCRRDTQNLGRLHPAGALSLQEEFQEWEDLQVSEDGPQLEQTSTPCLESDLDTLKRLWSSDTSLHGPVWDGGRQLSRAGAWKKQPSWGLLKSLKSLTTSEVRDVSQLECDPWWGWGWAAPVSPLIICLARPRAQKGNWGCQVGAAATLVQLRW